MEDVGHVVLRCIYTCSRKGENGEVNERDVGRIAEYGEQ